MSTKTSPIAIVGISCLFPKADDLQAYWANIKNGVNAITPVPAGSHWSAAPGPKQRGSNPGPARGRGPKR